MFCFRPVSNNSFTVESLTGQATNETFEAQHIPDIIPATSVNQPEDLLLSPYVDQITMLKCKLCGFLSSSVTGIDNHLYDEHEKQVGPAKIKEDENWQQVASKEGIRLHCPQCQNIFSSERSFTVHLTEDHMMTDSLAAEAVSKENQERKAKTLSFIQAKKEEMRLERKRKRQHGFEAYLDDGGELRIRQIAGNSHGTSKTVNSDDYQNKRTNTNNDNNHLSESTGQIVDMKATEYMDAVLKTGNTLVEITNQSSADLKQSSKDVTPQKCSRPKPGRPKGSRSIGLTAVRKLNPNITISDNMMGKECGVDGCAVRLKVLNLMIILRQ